MNKQQKLRTKYIVQTTTKRSGWGWESYHDAEADARKRYEAAIKQKDLATVRLYSETYDGEGNIVDRKGLENKR